MKKFLFFLATILLFASCQKSTINNNNSMLTIDYRKTTVTVIDVALNDTLIDNQTTSDNVANNIAIGTATELVDTMRYVRTHAKPNSGTPFNIHIGYFLNTPIVATSTYIKRKEYTFTKHLDISFEFRRSDVTFWNAIYDTNMPNNHITEVEYHCEQIVQMNYITTTIGITNESETKTDTLDCYTIKGTFTKAFGRLNSTERRTFKVIYECPLFLKR